MLNKFRESAKNVFYYRNSAISEDQQVKEAFKERKLALYFLVVSVVVLLLKFSVHRVGDDKWLAYLIPAKEMFEEVYALLVSFEWFITPILVGLAMGMMTWLTVYLDSFIPGISPPSPMSPRQLRIHSRTFHMGYYLAVIIGLLVASVMLYTNLVHPSKLSSFPEPDEPA